MRRIISYITVVSFLTVAIFAHFGGGNGPVAAEAGKTDSQIISGIIEPADGSESCACEKHNNKMTSLTCGVVLALLGGSLKNEFQLADAPDYEWSNRFGSELYPDPHKKPPRFIL